MQGVYLQYRTIFSIYILQILSQRTSHYCRMFKQKKQNTSKKGKKEERQQSMKRKEFIQKLSKVGLGIGALSLIRPTSVEGGGKR